MTDKEKIIDIVLDGKSVSAFKGETILDVASREGVKIPTLCHDPLLKPFASCFLCVVEVEGMKGLQPSCSTPVHEGMKIVTSGEKIKKARKTALELLLSNHYADCLGPCKLNCPAGVDIQGYISLIEKGLYSEAIALIKEANPLPAICGRVCVRPCELVCRRRLLEENSGVGIDYLKRFAADKDLDSPEPYTPVPEPDSGKRVAIIGAGPAGLSAAYWLRLKGHECHIYEAAPQTGGWLRYGIPEYRLPNEILDKEVEAITKLGVKIFCNKRLGEEISYSEIAGKYDAMILSPGSQLGTRLGCDGDDADGVMPGIDFLREMQLTGKHPDLKGQNVIVVGGGNTAMDCCRTAIRCGADSVKVVYRRSEKEMPANPMEIEESKIEGVEYLFLTNPVSVEKDSSGRIVSLTLQRMELGEPDASGRRRPVEIPGSEFTIKADLVLAAIGQKTDLSFINDINSNTTLGELKKNKWGEIDLNRDTLQTGVANIFAAGDAVTGPDTIIGAISQARIASNSCHQYLSGEPVKQKDKLFISKRDNFRQPGREDLPQRFAHRPRETMPSLEPSQRDSFSEVELGYSDESIVQSEASRCLECGCKAFPSCDLQRYATEYGAEQKKYTGAFNAVPQDYRHQFVSFDLNKCILCGRCVRICHEIAGADALGFFSRGFRTTIGPGYNMNLSDTDCSSCGLCIDTCPTGAITENTPFKPGPVVAKSFVTTDIIGSEGISVSLHHRGGFFIKATGEKSDLNPDGTIGLQARFSYRMLNRKRITKPLLKTNGIHHEISFDKAFRIIADKITSVNPAENAFFAGARLTNEEQYLIQKLARAVTLTNNIHSFHYLHRGKGYLNASDVNLPFVDLEQSDAFCVFGSDLFKSYQTVGFRVFNNMVLNDSPMTLISDRKIASMERKANETIHISSYYFFVKAVNAFIMRNNMFNSVFINSRCSGFENYKKSVLAEDFNLMVKNSGTSHDIIAAFCEKFNSSQRMAIIFAEEDISSSTAIEIRNLCLLTGKAGKTGSGIVCLKQCSNSQGIIDNGVRPSRLPGNIDLSNQGALIKLCQHWGSSGPGIENTCSYELLKENKLKNLFVFGEDPVGCAVDKNGIRKLLSGAEFIVSQDYFMTDTASLADLVLPSTFIFETGGSFTNSQRAVTLTERGFNGPVTMGGCAQVASIMKCLGYEQDDSPEVVRDEFLAHLPFNAPVLLNLEVTETDSPDPLFNNGCDAFSASFSDYAGSVENLGHDFSS